MGKDGMILYKKLSELIKAITPKYHGHFYYLNCESNKRESHKEVGKKINVFVVLRCFLKTLKY